MPSVYEEVDLAKMTFDAADRVYTYECPCGDFFEIGLEELHAGEEIAHCTGCTLKIRVLFDKAALPPVHTPAPEDPSPQPIATS